ncbi:DUF3995 domain-containing protein [Aggregicoccus sp. 17bor-14]|uniref:DUF3995 domain-containing protein n=1 Tax=Myxococcaceae TaxID=31 RepID=UPI00129C6162|nr:MULTISPECIES: DUF3995 domain-containing protein [Myxococcaceae]MBF5041837.1 DUF3995 domain-containing protein [Simulacricoccus sp. 17bor-14]MRI87618.1 DUF3995 domain-containing protein [Aggregicoccus sp. 17bor-14]
MVPLALTLAAVLIALALLHVYWAAGGRAGADAAVPEVEGRPAFVPGPNATLLVALGLSAAALTVLGRAHLWLPPWPPPPVFAVGTWVLAALFLLRAVGDLRRVGFFKRVKGTRFARRDTWVYSPLCLAMGLGLVGLALGG